MPFSQIVYYSTLMTLNFDCFVNLFFFIPTAYISEREIIFIDKLLDERRSLEIKYSL